MMGFNRNALLISSAVASAMVAAPAAAQTKTFDVRAQPAQSAINALGRQADIQIIAARRVTSNKRANAVRGNMTVEQALSSLLAGTGLSYQQTGPQTFTVVEKRAAVPSQTISSGSSTGDADVGNAPGESESASEADIVVTGSRLRRNPAEALTPVTTFNRTAIERTGGTSVREVLNLLPQASVNVDESGALNFGAVTTPQLRGLPIGSTLVLINGRRTVPSGVSSQGFDLSVIPLAAVERIEVLPDGASATYGADALAGVINIILKRNQRGGTIEARYGDRTAGSNAERRLSATYGNAVGPLSFTLFVDHFERDPIQGREISRTANLDFRRFGGTDQRTTGGNPGNVYSIDGSNLPGLNSAFAAVPTSSTGNLSIQDFLATAGTLNLSNPYETEDVISRTNRDAVGGAFEIDIVPTVRLFSEVLISDTRTLYRTGRHELTSGSFGFPVVSATNPFNPFGVPVSFDLSFRDEPEGFYRNKDKFLRAAVGVRGEFGSNWKWELAGLLTNQHTSILVGNQLDSSAVQAALDDPTSGFNPFATGALGPSAVVAGFFSSTTNKYSSEMRQADGNISGYLFQMPAGRVEVVLGTEIRKEKLKQATDFGTVDASRDTFAAYGELLVPVVSPAMGVPLVQRLTLTGALRYDHYSDFGDTTNPKVSLEWLIGGGFGARASYGTSFRAPPLYDLYSARFTFSPFLPDPRRGGELASFPITIGGNPNLQPEEGKSFNAGLIYSSAPGIPIRFEGNIDYFRIRNDGGIIRNGIFTILGAESSLPDRVIRATPTPGDVTAGFPGRILSLDASAINLTRIEVAGLDMRGTAILTNTAGQFTASVAATYTDKYDVTLLPGAAPQSRRGFAAFEGYAPKWKGNASLSYARDVGPDHVDASVTARYTSAYRDYDPAYRVRPQTTVDLQASYAIGDDRGVLSGTKATIGVINVFDRDPPFSNYFLGYDPQQGDIRGRFAYINLSKAF